MIDGHIGACPTKRKRRDIQSKTYLDGPTGGAGAVEVCPDKESVDSVAIQCGLTVEDVVLDVVLEVRVTVLDV